jgi:D-beta-D-heptose 7-phosphate kinase/D-beta-D-heptose 1-phosphate adenosyltransferase
MSDALTAPTLITSIERYADSTILCVGDVMLDHFVYGDVNRISPEAPIPILSVDHEQSMLGGAGNVVRNLTSLGARVIFLTVAGDDEEAGGIEELLGELPNCTACVMRDAERRTSVKTRYLAHSQQLLRVDAESVTVVGQDVLGQLLARFREFLPEAGVVILSDYAKGVLAGTNAQEFITAAVAAGKPVYVDPKGRDFSRYRNASLVKPNLRELAEATHMPLHDEQEVDGAARHLMREAGLETLLVTRGAAGMLLVHAGGKSVSLRSRAREVFDVSGAGDTVMAVLALGAATGLSREDAAEVACVAAGLVVGKVGTATLTQQEILRELGSAGALDVDAKITGFNECVQRVRLWRRMGLRIGLTSGCFDSLHAGHIAVLRQARERCDRLVVGVKNDDEERSRALVLASIGYVDMVIALTEAGADQLMRAIRPDVVLTDEVAAVS